MTSTLRFGRVAGSRSAPNWSWLLVFGLIVYSLAAGVFPTTNPGLSDGAAFWLGQMACTWRRFNLVPSS